MSLLTYSAAPQAPRKIWRYNYTDFDRDKEILAQVSAASVIVDDVSTSWSNWERLFLDTMENCIPTKILPRRRNLPRLLKSIIQCMRKRDMFYRKSKTSPHYLLKYRCPRNNLSPEHLEESSFSDSSQVVNTFGRFYRILARIALVSLHYKQRTCWQHHLRL